MAKNSHIEWTHHTFNPWWGCIKVARAVPAPGPCIPIGREISWLSVRLSTFRFIFKQWGHWVPAELMEGVLPVRIVEFANERSVEMVRLNKKVAGRVLEGTTWDGVPLTRPAHA